MDTLGDGYTPTNLRAVIAGEKTHTPRKSAAAPVKPVSYTHLDVYKRQASHRAACGSARPVLHEYLLMYY